jgi:anaerobic selenocysteine-containing dehydrogenase
MKELQLKVKRRAMPSKGRVRLNISTLTELGINDGDQIDLINDAGNKTVTVTTYADTMVDKKQVRVSDEDIKSLGLRDGDEVTVVKALPMMDKLKKAGADTKKNVTEKAEKAYESASKATKEGYEKARKAGTGTKKNVTEKAEKAYESASKATKKEYEKVKKKLTEKDL